MDSKITRSPSCCNTTFDNEENEQLSESNCEKELIAQTPVADQKESFSEKANSAVPDETVIPQIGVRQDTRSGADSPSG